jgi:hypothetical protein
MERMMECPHCHAGIKLTMQEIIAPYNMTLQITPEEGRMVGAKTVAGTIAALEDMLKATGDAVGHETSVHVSGLSVGDDMTVRITVACIPIARATP